MDQDKLADIVGKNLPVLPVYEQFVYPGASVAIRGNSRNGIRAIAKSQVTNGYLIVISRKFDSSEEIDSPEQLYKIGTLARIEQIVRLTSSEYALIVAGIDRIKISQIKVDDWFIHVNSHLLPDVMDVDSDTEKMLYKSILGQAREVAALARLGREFIRQLDHCEHIDQLIYLCAQYLQISSQRKQQFLEITSRKSKGLKILELLAEQKASLQLQQEINEKLSDKMNKVQRENLLREQLRAIREELGEEGASRGLREKIEDANMPADVEKIALEELKKLDSIQQGSPELHVIQNYLELLCSLPWSVPEQREIDLERARQILDEDHYGLKEIKDRIIQHLAVMKLKNDKKGAILLFVGPPGVGKTSLGKSIARVLEREFVRISLGGVRDESEIRGHRRTYIGAMCGRIIQGIKRAGTVNPVFVLDEVDKLARSFAGDPASALLEVLDPEQNDTFVDHYVDIPYDLSHVFFIATANSVDTVPVPLLDRMEVIRIDGYTDHEKQHICQRHLVSKQLAEHGLSEEQLVIPQKVQREIINRYTKEAGVRELQRKIAAICRASSEKVLAKDAVLPITIKVEDLEELLGPEKFQYEKALADFPPGVATGLAWTPLGGEILFIEAGIMPGKGNLMLTGQLGDVMKESAQIALSLVRSRVAALVPLFRFDESDIHIHIPSGAIPKDGPSAGITLLSAVASLVLGKKINHKLAMTGEITLRGAVMPVGGIKQKVLAAHRAEIQRIIMSRKNEKDLYEVPKEVREQIEFVFVDTVSEVLRHALGLETILEPAMQFGVSSIHQKYWS